MKNFKLIYPLLACLVVVCFTGCDRNVNDWGEDKEYAGLFRPLNFGESQIKATSIEIKYNTIANATKYVFEFSEDSMLFENIIKTVDILADTLTIFAGNDNLLKVEYRTLFEGFNGSTEYSVRMKGVNQRDGLESAYMSFAFTTPGEQLFTDNERGLDQITVFWAATPDVTHLSVSIYNAEKNSYDPLKDIQLGATEIAEGVATISDLSSGTTYRITINKDIVVRGTLTLKTLGMDQGRNVVVPVNATGVEVATLLSACVNDGVSSVGLLFEDNTATYNLGSVTIPNGIDNITFIGAGPDDKKPLLILKSVGFATLTETIGFENVSIDGDTNAYFISANKFTSLYFDGCEITNLGRSVLRLGSGDGVDIESVKFNDCVISNIPGTYGIISLGKDGFGKFGEIAFTNCTFFEIAKQLYAGETIIDVFTIDHCTLYNSENCLMDQLFTFLVIPTRVNFGNTIISGPNKGGGLRSGAADYSSCFDFSENCYLTLDVPLYKFFFTNITEYSGASTDLFVDPQNGDFHFKDASFSGRDSAGDPRWY